MRGILELLDIVIELPTLTTISDEINGFWNAFAKQLQENKLFKF